MLLKAGDSQISNGGFPDSHYESLWKSSPFSAESSLGNPTGEIDPRSSEFTLVGVVKIDDVFYANIQDLHSGEIFVLSNSKPSHGIVLLSVHRGDHPRDSYAVLEKGSQRLTLYLERADGSTPGTTSQPIPSSTTPPPPKPNSPSVAPSLMTPALPEVSLRPTISLTPAPITTPPIIVAPPPTSTPSPSIPNPSLAPTPSEPPKENQPPPVEEVPPPKPKFRATTIDQRN